MTSHGVLSPVAASKSALDGLSDTMQLMRQVGGAQLRGAFACRVDVRTTNDQQVAPLLTDRLGSVADGGKAFSSFIRETVKVREAETAQVPPPFYDASMTAATDYRMITEELLKVDGHEMDNFEEKR